VSRVYTLDRRSTNSDLSTYYSSNVQVRKTESSLRRLKKGRAGEAAAMEGAMLVSDTDKISMQLFLDVQVAHLPMDPRSRFKKLEGFWN